MSEPAAPPKVSLGAIFRAFLLIGATSFGGGVVAYLRDSLVVKQAWLDDDDFLGALEISQTLPGLNATNMSILVGDKLRGPLGALVAFLGMALPGTVVIFGLGVLYGQHATNLSVGAALGGVGAAAVGLLIAVTWQIGRKELAHSIDILIVLVTCVAISLMRVSLLTALLTIGPVAVWLYRPRPSATQADS